MFPVLNTIMCFEYLLFLFAINFFFFLVFLTLPTLCMIQVIHSHLVTARFYNLITIILLGKTGYQQVWELQSH